MRCMVLFIEMHEVDRFYLTILARLVGRADETFIYREVTEIAILCKSKITTYEFVRTSSELQNNNLYENYTTIKWTKNVIWRPHNINVINC